MKLLLINCGCFLHLKKLVVQEKLNATTSFISNKTTSDMVGRSLLFLVHKEALSSHILITKAWRVHLLIILYNDMCKILFKLQLHMQGWASIRFDFGIKFWFQIGSSLKIKKKCSVFMEIKTEPKLIGQFQFGFGSQFQFGFDSRNDFI